MPTNYYAEGAGAALLPNPVLQYIAEDDPVLGTSDPLVPEGPFNRELWKLLQNESALANVLQGYLTRTVGSAPAASMPDPVVAPVPMPGASTTPAHGDYHTLFYQDYEALFKYDALSVSPGWVYVWSVALSAQEIGSGLVLSRSTETVQTVLTAGSSLQIEIAIPSGYTIAHLKTFYIVCAGDPESIPVVSVMPFVFTGVATLRMVLSTEPALNATYTLMCIFEKFTTL